MKSYSKALKLFFVFGFILISTTYVKAEESEQDTAGPMVCVQTGGSCGGISAPKPGCECCSVWMEFWSPGKGVWVCDNSIGMQCPSGWNLSILNPCPYPGQFTGSCAACFPTSAE